MNLNSIFYPKSIAVIGASTEVGHVGNDIVKNLITQGYKGKIFPVNPKRLNCMISNVILMSWQLKKKLIWPSLWC